MTIEVARPVIEGLKIKVSNQELSQHMRDRSKYHLDQIEIQKAQIAKIEASLPQLKELQDTMANNDPTKIANMGKMSSNYVQPANILDEAKNKIAELENSNKDRKNKSLVFLFFADHLFEGDYSLAESDLQRLEILRR